jgi:large subunit ribosomal protein L3
MKFIIGTKQEMDQIFSANGEVLPVTKIKAGPCFICEKKETAKDGYRAVKVAFSETKNVNKPLAGFFKKILGNESLFYSNLHEFRLDESDKMFDKLSTGNKLDAEIFAVGDIVDVTGISKGKGFQGVVKRHHFHGSPASHGHKDQLRMPGSIGAGEPQHVFPGMRMGGHMGNEQKTSKNLEVVAVVPEANEIWVKGAVPGATGCTVLIKGDGEFEVKAAEAAKDTQKTEEVKQ